MDVSLEMVLVGGMEICKSFVSKVVGAIGFEPTIRQKMSSHVHVHLIFSCLQMHGPV